jgi:hypothetical protein
MSIIAWKGGIAEPKTQKICREEKIGQNSLIIGLS